jgi:hypothetical protein
MHLLHAPRLDDQLRRARRAILASSDGAVVAAWTMLARPRRPGHAGPGPDPQRARRGIALAVLRDPD